MPRPDLLDQSATRVELDQRSRDARLRLEYVERLLVLRPLQRQSLLRRVLRCLRSRTRLGEQISGRPLTAVAAPGRGPREQEMSGDSGGAAGGFPGAPPPGAWPNCPRGARIGPGRSDPGWSDHALIDRAAVWLGFKAWDHRCGRGDLNSRPLSDNRF
jgi:hypothetical protein